MDAKKRLCYNILETAISDDGQYIPTIVKEGESGYCLTDWLWGKDIEIARKCADKKNKALGLSCNDVDEIVLSSMFKTYQNYKP